MFSSSLSLTDTSHPLIIHPFYLYPDSSKHVQRRLICCIQAIEIEVRRGRDERLFIDISYAQKIPPNTNNVLPTPNDIDTISTTKDKYNNREGLPNSPSPSRSHARDDLDRVPLFTTM